MAASKISLGKYFWARGAGAPVRTPLRDGESIQKSSLRQTYIDIKNVQTCREFEPKLMTIARKQDPQSSRE